MTATTAQRIRHKRTSTDLCEHDEIYGDANTAASVIFNVSA
jgi:hypothetical protein